MKSFLIKVAMFIIVLLCLGIIYVNKDYLFVLFLNLIQSLNLYIINIFKNGITSKSVFDFTVLLFCIVIAIITIVVLTRKLQTQFSRYLYRTQIKNEYTYGKEKLLSDKEKVKNYYECDADDVKLSGWLLSQYKVIYIFNKRINVNIRHFKVNKKLETLEADAINKYNTIKKQKEYMNKVMSKRNILDKLLIIVEKVPFITIKNKLLIDVNPKHELVVATTRAGKTQTKVLPELNMFSKIKVLKNQPSLIISDPKEELYASTHKSFEKAGYKVLAINTANPKWSNKYNPLYLATKFFLEEVEEGLITINKEYTKYFSYKEIDGTFIVNNKLNDISKKTKENFSLIDFLELIESFNFSKTTNEIMVFSNSLFADGTDGDGNTKFYNESAKNLNSSVLFDLLQTSLYETMFDEKDEEGKLITNSINRINILGLNIHRNILCSQNEQQIPTFQIMRSSYPATNYAATTFPGACSPNTFGNIVSTIESQISVFCSDDMANLLGSHDFSFDNIAEGTDKYVIFLVTPDYDTKYNAIITMFVNSIFTYLSYYADNNKSKKLKREVRFILEEFANIPALDDIGPKLTVCLGRGIRFQLVVQNIGQIKAIYGEDTTSTIMDNMHIKSYLQAGDSETREWFSKNIGSTTIIDVTTSKDNDKFRKKFNYSASEKEKRLVTPEELNQNTMEKNYQISTGMSPSIMLNRPAFSYIDFDIEGAKESVQKRWISKKELYFSSKDMYFNKNNSEESDEEMDSSTFDYM